MKKTPTTPPRLPSARPAARPRAMPKRKLRVVPSALPPDAARAVNAAPARLLPAAAPILAAAPSEPGAAVAPGVARQPQVPAQGTEAPVAVATLPHSGDPVADVPQLATAVAAASHIAPAANALVRRGGLWEISFGDHRGIVEDCRGLHYLALIIRDAGPEKGPIHAKELVALASGQDPRAVELDATECVLDTVAKAQLVERLTEIATERTTASAADDYAALAALDEEYDRIAEELSRAANAKSRRGGFSHDGEKARKAVGKAITQAIQRVAANPDLAPLARHFTATVRKGQWLSYADSRDWQIDLQLLRK